MESSRRYALAAILSLWTLACGVHAREAPKPQNLDPLSAERFFTPNPVGPVDISPSGRFLAVREVNAEGRRQLKVVDLEGKEPPRIVARFVHHDVDWFDWLDDEWLLFDTSDDKNKGRRREGSGLAAVAHDGTRMRELIRKSWGQDSSFIESKAVDPIHSLSGYGPPGSKEIVLEEYHAAAGSAEYGHVTLKIQNVATGGLRSFKDMPAPPRKVTSWTLDQLGQPRVASTNDKQDTIIYWFDVKAREWRKIAQFEEINAEFQPAFVNEKDELFVEAINPKTHLTEIRKFNFATGKPENEAVLSLPGFDANATPVQDHGSNKIYGLRTLTDASSIAWFSPVMANIQRKADALLPNRVNHLACRPCAAPKVVLIHSYADNTPGDYLIYRVAEDKFERIAELRPGHRTDLMANLELYRTTTRDGADLPAWVTKLEGKGNAPRPAVVLVHGGPWSRATSWKWDSEAQFLATRGYVVIEPEFRGSTGYGDKHHRAGWKQWGQRMQDDVADSVKFAVDMGWVDPGKVCIAGASYGGYAALMGLIKDPGLYKCAVAWVAVSDPRMMYTVHWSSISDWSRDYSMPHMIGDLEKDAEMLKANAPIELASKIKAPVLLAYGLRDYRVPIVHGEKMRTALTDAGNAPEWVVYDDEGHGWRRPPNIIDFWSRVERFLGRHLK